MSHTRHAPWFVKVGFSLVLSAVFEVAIASADFIVIDKLQQESRVQANVGASTGPQEGYTNVYHSGGTGVTQVPTTQSATSNAAIASPASSARAHADQQFPMGSYVLTSASLAVAFSANNDGSITNVVGGGDSASVFDIFCVSFTTDRDLSFSLNGSVTASGDLTPTGQITDPLGGAHSVYLTLSKTSGAGAFSTIEIYDNATLATQTGILPMGSYHLIGMASYRVAASGSPLGSDLSGTTFYAGNFGLSAVPEPSSLGLSCVALAVTAMFRRRGRQ